MLANLWMLNAPNGMFWYAVDYLREMSRPTLVLVRPHLLEAAQKALECDHIRVRACGLQGLLTSAAMAAWRGELLYCPTSHPIPWLRNQLVTFHDPYPFDGPKGRLKLRAFRWGARSSKCRIAYINRTVALPFLQELGVPEAKLLFAPNMPPAASSERRQRRNEPDSSCIVLGAFGTDSEKKRYPELLETVERSKFRNKIHLRIYGEMNDYTRLLKNRYPRAHFDIVEPISMSLSEFIASLDGVVSVALSEGFGRPLATAIVAGLPCYLADSPTFREFFNGLALLSVSIDDLLTAAVERRRPDSPIGTEVGGFQSAVYTAAIDTAIHTLRLADVRAAS